MEFIQKHITANTVFQKGCAELGVDGDVIVPDVMPDILKVVQVDGDACITSKESGGGKLVCEGKLYVKILYIPDSEEEKIKSIISSFDFSHTFANAEITDSTVADVSVDVTRADFQLINSRKLKIKAVAAVSYAVSQPQNIAVACDVDEEGTLETRKKSITTLSFVALKDTQFLCTDSFVLPSGQPSIKNVLKIDADIIDTEFKVISGRIVVKGTCGICVLYCDTSDDVRFSEFELPFTEIIDLDDANEDTLCELDFSVGGIEYRLETDSDGDVRIINTEITVCVSVYAYEKEDIEYIDDCFCPGRNMTVNKEMKKIECILASAHHVMNLKEIIPPHKNGPVPTGVYNLTAKPVIDSVTSGDGTVRIDGKIICYCQYTCGGDDIPVCSIRHEVPFSETVDAEGSLAGSDCRIRADISHKSFMLNSAGETEIRLSAVFDVTVTKDAQVPVISDFTISEIDDDEKKGIVIYFVQPGDELWDIAKRYRVCPESVAELNNLEEKPLSAGTQILIPTA